MGTFHSKFEQLIHTKRFIARVTPSRDDARGVSPWPRCKSGQGKRRVLDGTRLLKALSGYLPNDPARQKTTSNQQYTSTKRYSAGNRDATRARQRRSRSTGRRCSSRCRRSSRGSRRSSVDVDVTTSSYALEASEHLVLADTQLLGNGAEVVRIRVLVLPDRSLDLVAVHILDATSDR